LRYIHLAAFLAGSLAVVLTLGKGAILSLAAGLFYFFHISRSKRFVFIVSFLMFCALAYLFFTPYIEGLYERTVNALRDTNIEFRLDEYKAGWKIFKDHPLVGVGSGQQLAWYQKMIDPNYRNFANNFFLQAALDFGAAGIGAMLIVVLAVIFKIAGKRKALSDAGPSALLLTGMIAAGITAFLNGMVEVTFFALPYAILFWTMFGMVEGVRVRGEYA
jgi:O-antigen ligase